MQLTHEIIQLPVRFLIALNKGGALDAEPMSRLRLRFGDVELKEVGSKPVETPKMPEPAEPPPSEEWQDQMSKIIAVARLGGGVEVRTYKPSEAP